MVVRLPDELRSAFKDPLGPLYTDAEELLSDAGEPLIAVGDIVTYHFEQADRRPDVALVDGRTKRQAVDDEVRETVEAPPDRIAATNPAGTLTVELLTALGDAVARDGPTTVVVDGEEDLATLPAVLAAPEGATVVYGQPDRGMVAVDVTAETRAEFRDLLERMDGDRERLWALLDAEA
nr:GTP-dependent dephospho-CoA kinase family protein [Natronoarchaeum philippinense]